jgi:hypothetical protein
MLVIVGAMTIPVVLQMIKELVRQTYYGGGVIDTRAQPASITNDPKIPANMVVVINADGKTGEYTSNQISPDFLKSWLKK